jgi:hypothetical protein
MFWRVFDPQYILPAQKLSTSPTWPISRHITRDADKQAAFALALWVVDQFLKGHGSLRIPPCDDIILGDYL